MISEDLFYRRVDTEVNSIGSNYVYVIIPVTNTGTENLYFSTCSIDIEDTDGHLVDTISLASVNPTVLAPGETAVIYESTINDDLAGIKLNAIPHITAKKATVPLIRYPVSDLSIKDNSEFRKVLNNVEQHITRWYTKKSKNFEFYYAESPLFVREYQGRIYVFKGDEITPGTIKVDEVTVNDLEEYITIGYEKYLYRTERLKMIDPVLYECFVTKGLAYEGS